MCDKAIRENGETFNSVLLFIQFRYKIQEMCNKAVDN